METHGGRGVIFARCYAHLLNGIVFEKAPDKAAILGRQRPTWAVYEADCISAIRDGVGSHLPVNFLDCDPYGNPWPTIDAFLESKRPLVDILVIAVNDGLRQKVQLTGGWSVGSLQQAVDRFGNGEMYQRYLEVCQIMLKEKAAKAGYALRRWTGYHCGFNGQMTHYCAVLKKLS